MKYVSLNSSISNAFQFIEIISYDTKVHILNKYITLEGSSQLKDTKSVNKYFNTPEIAFFRVHHRLAVYSIIGCPVERFRGK